MQSDDITCRRQIAFCSTCCHLPHRKTVPTAYWTCVVKRKSSKRSLNKVLLLYLELGNVHNGTVFCPLIHFL